MTKFEKGNKFGKGRPLGSTNKINNDIRERFLELLETNLQKFQEDLDNLEPKERIKTMINLASFVIPKLKAIEYKEENSQMKIIEFNLKDALKIGSNE